MNSQLNPESIVVGCNYHTKHQSHPGMRFVLKEVKGDKARLITRKSQRSFWIDVKDIIFIMTYENIAKAEKLLKWKELGILRD